MPHPWVLSNTAMSIDGKIAPFDRTEVAISSEADFRRRDRLRSTVDAILVGGQTVRTDDPGLRIYDAPLVRARMAENRSAHPLGIVVTSQCDLPVDGHFLNTPDQRRLILTTRRAPLANRARVHEKAEVLLVGDDTVDLVAALGMLGDRGIRRILVEAGGTLLFALIRLGLIDEMFVSINALILGGCRSPTAVDGIGFDYPHCPRPRLIQCFQQDAESVVLHYRLDSSPRNESPSTGSMA